jgi:hypothetical protein
MGDSALAVQVSLGAHVFGVFVFLLSGTQTDIWIWQFEAAITLTGHDPQACT